MLVRLYASEIILEKITIDDVPNKLKDKVRKYLEDMGYEV
nr:MAG TPA: Ribose 5-phosphate isomerase B [Caudoviricetes sp.]